MTPKEGTFFLSKESTCTNKDLFVFNNLDSSCTSHSTGTSHVDGVLRLKKAVGILPRPRTALNNCDHLEL